jgi:hypothetical protein
MILVVTRYKESIDFLDSIPEFADPDIECIVYNKGGEEGLHKVNRPRVTYINIENVGMCDHTVFYHIFHNYENINDTILFIPASIEHPSMKFKLDKAIRILRVVKNHPNTTVFNYEEKYTNVKDHYENFIINYWNPRHESNREENYKINSDYGHSIIHSELRPFSRWYNTHFGNMHTQYVSLWCIFAVNPNSIRMRSRDFYKNILDELSVGPNVEVGHYLERAWQAVFSIPNNSDNWAAYFHQEQDRVIMLK